MAKNWKKSGRRFKLFDWNARARESMDSDIQIFMKGSQFPSILKFGSLHVGASATLVEDDVVDGEPLEAFPLSGNKEDFLGGFRE